MGHFIAPSSPDSQVAVFSCSVRSLSVRFLSGAVGNWRANPIPCKSLIESSAVNHRNRAVFGRSALPRLAKICVRAKHYSRRKDSQITEAVDPRQEQSVQLTEGRGTCCRVLHAVGKARGKRGKRKRGKREGGKKAEEKSSVSLRDHYWLNILPHTAFSHFPPFPFFLATPRLLNPCYPRLLLLAVLRANSFLHPNRRNCPIPLDLAPVGLVASRVIRRPV